MGNCLVTKLKGIVNNDSLRKIDEARFIVEGVTKVTNIVISAISQDEQFTVNFSQPVSYSNNGGALVEGATSYTGSLWGFEIYLPVGNTTITINNKYKIRDFINRDATSEFNVTFDTGLLASMREIRTSTLAHYYLNLEDIACPNNLYVMLNDSARGNIESLASSLNLRELGFRGGIYGNVEALANCVGMIALSIANTNVEGRLDVLFDAWVSKGKSSGSVLLTSFNNNCTITGASLWHDTNVNFGSSMVEPTAEETARGWQTRNYAG